MTKKILILRIKNKYLDDILNGTKKIEYRNFTQYYINRFCVLNKKRTEIIGTKEYDYIKLIAGYRKDSPQNIFEINGIYIATDEKNEPIEFEIEIGKKIE